MHEIVLNLHMHTRYSDGSGSHRDIARAAIRANLDAVIITDHNAWIGGMERYFHQDSRKVLVLIGEEVHDRTRLPQKDHLLVLGADQETAQFAEGTADLLYAIRRSGGLSFIAHPIDPAASAFHEPDISWENWEVGPFTGIELWNGLSELKSLIPSRLRGLVYAFLPTLVAHGPPPAAIRRWDSMLSTRAVVAVGGSDAHALQMRSGLLRRIVFPYEYHFRAVNTHIFLTKPLTGIVKEDAVSVYRALAAGRCFIGYDLPRSTRGFLFTAHAAGTEVCMGGQIAVGGGVTLRAKLPALAEIRLIRNGEVIQRTARGQVLTRLVNATGVYRVEAHRRYLGHRRAWIFSNPIYVE